MLNRLFQRVSRYSTRPRVLSRAVRLVLDPHTFQTYHPEAQAKSRGRMALENLRWSWKHGEVNEKYFLYGLDRTDGPRAEDFIPAGELMAIISRQIREMNAGPIAAMLKDKFLFSLVARALGYSSPPILAVLRPDGVERLTPHRHRIAWEDLVGAEEEIDGFCKPVRGRHGERAFRLRIGRGELRINGEEATVLDLRTRLAGASILQERVVQHALLAALYPHSVNTLRLITALQGGEVVLFEAVLRVGANGGVIDNWSGGGIVTSIDRQSGTVRGLGMSAPGKGAGWVATHPETGVLLDGYVLPAFAESVSLVRRFHRDLGAPRTIAWDVAVTPDGPTLVEANTHWDGGLHMALDPCFRDRYMELVDSPLA